MWREHPRVRRTLTPAICLSVAASACWIAFAVALSIVVDGVFLGDRSLGAVRGLLAGMLSLVLVRGALVWAGEILAQRAATGLKDEVRERLIDKLLALGPAAGRDERTGELVYVVGEGVEALDAYVVRYRPARALAMIVPILVAIVVFALDPWTVLVLLFAGPVLVVLLALIGRRVGELSTQRERELAWLSAHFLDVLRGLPTLKMFGRSAEQADTIEEVSRRYGASTMDVLRTAFQTTLVLEWGTTAATAFVAIEASARLLSGGLPFGRALAALLLAPEFFVPLRRLAAEYHTGTAGTAAAETIHALLDEPVRVGATTEVRPLPSRFDLRIDDVHVTFDDGTRPALGGCTFEVPHGRTVALIGATGAGKTTVANVLLRFVDPERGSVAVADTPLAELDPVAWRTAVAWVPQHPTLFHGTVAQNLRLARADATNDELEAAARAANAHGFVSALPDGYGTLIGENGAHLSGGERQRLAIARAFLKDAPVLLLDEPTSHLDDESHDLVVEAIARVLQDRTVLLIAHRLELAEHADLVAVLHEGRVVDIGPPAEILHADGVRTLASAAGRDPR